MLLVLALVAVAAASPTKYDSNVVQQQHGYEQQRGYEQQSTYHGRYDNKCEHDGFYYRNENSFVVCSNNNAYVQPCAPGSRNSGYEQYSSGNAYSYRDFCDVNLVDHGYGVKGSGYDDSKHYGNNNGNNNGYDKRSGYADKSYGGKQVGGYGRQYDDVSYGKRDAYNGATYNGPAYDRYERPSYNNGGSQRRADRGYYGDYDRYNRQEYYPTDRYYGAPRRDGYNGGYNSKSRYDDRRVNSNGRHY